jgi:microtubule-associated protein-like 6
MGIWEKGIEGSNYTDIVSVCRSNHQKIIATGDHFSKVKIYKYPCNKDRSRFKEFYGHASFVTNLKFSKNDKYLISTGGNDLSVLVWEVQDS